MKLLNVILFLLTACFTAMLIVTGYPFQSLFVQGANVIAVFRITFSLIYIIKFIRSFKAIPIIFGYEVAHKSKKPEVLFYLNIFLASLLMVGFFTEVTACLLLVLYIYLFSLSKHYSIENIYFQNTLFFLPFINLANPYSVDYYLGIKPFLASAVMFNGLFIANALIMLSGGYEKLKSKLWQKGQGAVAFLLMPHLSKRALRGTINRVKPVLVVLGYGVMLAEFLMPFSIVNLSFFNIVAGILVLFALSLMLVVDLSFIGEVTLLNLVLFFSVINMYHPANAEVGISLNFSGLTVYHVILFIVSFVSLVCIFFPKFSVKNLFSKAARYLNGIYCPIAVFTERQLFGFYTYKLEYTETKQQLLSAFDHEGCFGNYQFFRPRYFQASMYPVTDYCLLATKHGKIGADNPKFGQMVDLCYAALRSIHKSIGSISIKVKKYDYNDDYNTYILRDWDTIVSLSFNETGYSIAALQKPVPVEKTFRVV